MPNCEFEQTELRKGLKMQQLRRCAEAAANLSCNKTAGLRGAGAPVACGAPNTRPVLATVANLQA